MGENHVRVYHKMEQANLLAVSDVSERALKKIEKKYGAKGFTEYSELLENPEIEAVSVCVPTTFHHAVVMEAIKYGKHVLVEKPIANTTLLFHKVALVFDKHLDGRIESAQRAISKAGSF
jgi:UDP-N-acetylglucosamine 3-dehydrogenase